MMYAERMLFQDAVVSGSSNDLALCGRSRDTASSAIAADASW
ncbi:hypothetical protein EDD30_6527 [Couchioplanes caeruleus]|uniref:Uncharacterized protein n=1 Tax=Couchioplanes caeruleus TaxID=56438 RepID=A0A3N1GTU2_9ACTN|nr:hypothetical protein [Couchioplanes caeruleus]ROP33536.1 hypothetical protein EDD30_6527 [Couchioplanes caeruleus]